MLSPGCFKDIVNFDQYSRYTTSIRTFVEKSASSDFDLLLVLHVLSVLSTN